MIEKGTAADLAQALATLHQETRGFLHRAPRIAWAQARVAYEIANGANDRRAKADLALLLADALNMLGEFRLALPLYHQAKALYTDCGDKENALLSLCEAAWTNTVIGQLSDAVVYIQRVRENAPSLSLRARCDWIEARVLRDQGDYNGPQNLDTGVSQNKI